VRLFCISSNDLRIPGWELAGLAWGEVPSDSILIFSPIQNIEDDFNVTFDVTGAPPLSTWIAGPSQVRSSEWCTWQAFTDGGESPFHYAWSGVLSGSGSQNWIGGTVSSSGWLNVTVTSDDNQQVNASFWVEVSASAPNCPL